jgi:hypothetical protein
MIGAGGSCAFSTARFLGNVAFLGFTVGDFAVVLVLRGFSKPAASGLLFLATINFLPD